MNQPEVVNMVDAIIALGVMTLIFGVGLMFVGLAFGERPKQKAPREELPLRGPAPRPPQFDSLTLMKIRCVAHNFSLKGNTFTLRQLCEKARLPYDEYERWLRG